jgi:WD40 repeat protein
VWSVPEDRVLHQLDTGSVVRALAAAPDGKLVASAGDDGAIQLWGPATGKPGLKLTGAGDWQLALAFSPDGRTLASGGYDGKLRTWDVASGKKLVETEALPPLPANTPKDAPTRPLNVVGALAFSPDGKSIALGGSEAGVHLFQAADGKLVRSLSGHTGSISTLVFHPSGTLLVSASKDRTLRLWNPTTGQMIKALEGHTAWVQGAVFLAHGTRLASVGADQAVRLWDLADPKAKK